MPKKATKSVFESFVSERVTSAKDEAFKEIKRQFKSRRSAERFRSERGAGGPYDRVTARDLERLQKDGRFDVLYAEDQAFRERADLLIDELREARNLLDEAGRDAEMRSHFEAPKILKLLDRQLREREDFLARHGAEDIMAQEIPEHVKLAYKEMVETHERAAENARLATGND